MGTMAGLDGCRKTRPLWETAKNVPVNTKLVQTHVGTACDAHAHCAPLQTGCGTALPTTDTQAWINKIIIIKIIIIMVPSLQFLRSDNTEA